MTAGSLRTSSGLPRAIVFAEVEHVHGLRDAHDEPHVVLDEQHGQVEPLAELEEEVAERRHLLVAEPAGRLVEQQQTRLGHERAGQLDALQRRIREPRRDVTGETAQPDELERLVRALAGRPPRGTSRVREWAPTRTFSSTVIREKSAMFWNVRAMPAADDVVRRRPSAGPPVVEDLRRNPACRVE